MTQKSERLHFGFTLVEFVVVVLVVAALAAYSSTRWSSGVNPNAQAQQIAADIRYVQSLAMTHNQGFAINFTTSSPNSYYITTSAVPGTQLPNSVTGDTPVLLGTGVTFGTVSNTLISFDDFGVPYISNTQTAGNLLGSTATIQITGGGTTKTISISPTTGFVAVT